MPSFVYVLSNQLYVRRCSNLVVHARVRKHLYRSRGDGAVAVTWPLSRYIMTNRPKCVVPWPLGCKTTLPAATQRHHNSLDEALGSSPATPRPGEAGFLRGTCQLPVLPVTARGQL